MGMMDRGVGSLQLERNCCSKGGGGEGGQHNMYCNIVDMPVLQQ